MGVIYDVFKNTLKKIFDSKKYTLPRMLNLLSGFMNFSVNFYEGNLEYINEILKMATELCNNEE